MITVIQPDPKVNVDRFGPWLRAHDNQVVNVALFERSVPALDDCGDGIVVLGGTMNAVDEEASPWLPELKKLLVDAVEADVPVFGICLGHQILAEAFGGRVQVKHPTAGEDGAFTVNLTDAGKSDPVMGALGAKAVMPESHNDVVVDLPSNATLLASSDKCDVQAFRIGSAVGVQFHPEASPRTMGFWHSLSGGDAAEMTATMEAVDSEVVTGGRALAEAFLAQL